MLRNLRSRWQAAFHPKSALRDAWQYREKPLVLDRRFDIAYFWLWVFYGAWGISSAIVNTQYLEVPFSFYPSLWGTLIGALSIIACSTIVASFFTAPDRLRERIREKKIEAVTVTCLAALIGVFPILQALLLITDYPPRFDSLFLGCSYMVMVVYRVSVQLRRIQDLKLVDRRYQEGRQR